MLNYLSVLTTFFEHGTLRYTLYINICYFNTFDRKLNVYFLVLALESYHVFAYEF